MRRELFPPSMSRPAGWSVAAALVTVDRARSPPRQPSPATRLGICFRSPHPLGVVGDSFRAAAWTLSLISPIRSASRAEIAAVGALPVLAAYPSFRVERAARRSLVRACVAFGAFSDRPAIPCADSRLLRLSCRSFPTRARARFQMSFAPLWLVALFECWKRARTSPADDAGPCRRAAGTTAARGVL